MKAVIDLAALVLVSPLILACWLGKKLSVHRYERLFQFLSQALSLFPGFPGDVVRRSFYRYTLSKCGKGLCVSFGTTFATSQVEIGNGVYIGAACNIGHSSIGNDVLIGTGVMILGGKRQHSFRRLDIPIRHQGGEVMSVQIGDDCWIGNGAIIASNVGAHCVVGAGAVVAEAVTPLSIVMGNPGITVGKREHRHG